MQKLEYRLYLLFGFTFEEIVTDLIHPERVQFLLLLDVLIDGPYKQDLDNEHGLRGSTNQRVFLTDRLAAHDFENNREKSNYIKRKMVNY